MLALEGPIGHPGAERGGGINLCERDKALREVVEHWSVTKDEEQSRGDPEANNHRCSNETRDDSGRDDEWLTVCGYLSCLILFSLSCGP